jgi:hypothetical protein
MSALFEAQARSMGTSDEEASTSFARMCRIRFLALPLVSRLYHIFLNEH